MKKSYSQAWMPFLFLFVFCLSAKAQITVNLSSSTNVQCAGGSNGAISVTATGGTPPYTYSWAPAPGVGQGTANASGMVPGTYTVTVHDAVAATNNYVGSITQPPGLAPSGNPVNESCAGGTNGSASVTVTGGSVPYTYSWSPVAGATNSITNQPVGTYTCHITDSHGCVINQNVTITQPGALLAGASPTNPICAGGTGSIVATPSGGSPAYTYSWSPVGGSTATANVSAGTYTCFVTDSHGCTASTTQTLNNPPSITTPFSQTNVSCYGGTNGSATVTAANGFAPYTYSWHPIGGPAPTATGLTANSFTCFVTDSHGCMVTQMINISQPPTALTATVSAQSNILCYGASTGSATVSGNGGTPPFTYSWSPISNSTSTANGLAAGSFNCMVTDSKGCTYSQGVTITQVAALTATDTHTNISCNGGATGSINVIPAGGSPGYYYNWTPTGGSSNTVSAMAAGTYTCTITDMNSCALAYPVTLSQPSTLNISATSTNVTCFASGDGTATATASGGVATYTYSWSPPSSSSPSVSGLTPGSYTCHVTDQNGCTNLTSVSINQSATALTASVTGSVNATCNGSSNGSATVSAAGGTTPYTYSWSPGGAATPTAPSLSAGTYSCTITDAYGCSVIKTVTITAPSAINVSIASQSNVSCNGGSNGSISLTVTGGTPTYTYAWIPSGGTASSASSLAAGTYSCTVHDAQGCAASSSSVTIAQPAPIVMTPSSVQSHCNGPSGSASVTPSGGTAPYTYSWSPTPGSGSSITSIPAGTYSVHLTDMSGCVGNANITVTNQMPSLAVAGTNLTCAGNSSGTATASITGGQAPFTYSWSPAPGGGQGSATATGLSASTYTLTLTDSYNCVVSQTAAINQPAAIATGHAPVGVACNGMSDGTDHVTASGGTGAFTYSWSPAPGTGQGSQIVSSLSPGTYTCTVTDANGCSNVSTVTITQPTAITMTGSGTNPSCAGTANGLVSITASGGTNPYTYFWSPVAGSSPSLSGIAANTYTCTLTDANGCSTTKQVAITDPPALNSNATSKEVSCNSFCDGTITLTASGGVPVYTYSWNPGGATTPNLTGLCAGNYTCTITDANGCNINNTVPVNQPAKLANSLTSSDASCGSACDGSAMASVTGGNAPYVYSWVPGGQTTATIGSLCQGTYTSNVIDAMGCTIQGTTSISTHASPVITGTVTSPSSGAITSGWAYLVQYDSILKREKLTDSVAISAGRYTFSKSFGGKFLIYALANSASYPNAIKTYSDSTDLWNKAKVLYAACASSDTANIKLIELIPTTGAGSLGGRVTKALGYTGRMMAGTAPGICTPGDPIPGLDVNLEQHPGGIIKQVQTDASGNYHFTNVPPGIFEVFVDIPGLGMVSQYKRTVTSNQIYSGLDYRIDSVHIYPDTVLSTGIVQHSVNTENHFSVYPNPFRDQLTVSYTIAETSDIVIQMYNVLGQEIFQVSKVHQEAGSYSYPYRISENGIQPGVYMLKLTAGGNSTTRRIVSVR
jgi:hypothetical protein